MKHGLLVVACLIGVPLLAAEPLKPQFRAGAATSNITPPLGGPIIGNFTTPPATNVHDELHARCIVLDDGKVRLALVVCDLLGIGYDVSTEARKRCPIQPSQLVSLTHGYMGYLPAPRHFPLGGYETWLGTSRLEPDASVKMLDTLLEMAAEVKE
jgi:hypothetical protein